MTLLIIPTIGSAGSYSLSPPYNVYTDNQVIFTCTGVRTIGDYLAAGEDVKTNIYVKYGLTDSDYINDVKDNTPIVTLQDDNGTWLYIPARFILSYPVTSGVVYHGIALVVSLGLMQINHDMSTVNTLIENTVYDALGITPKVSSGEISKPVILTHDDSDLLETARKNKATLVLSDRGKSLNLEMQLNSSRQKIRELETFIRSKNLT
jgi:hypothetical protein